MERYGGTSISSASSCSRSASGDSVGVGARCLGGVTRARGFDGERGGDLRPEPAPGERARLRTARVGHLPGLRDRAGRRVHLWRGMRPRRGEASSHAAWLQGCYHRRGADRGVVGDVAARQHRHRDRRGVQAHGARRGSAPRWPSHARRLGTRTRPVVRHGASKNRPRRRGRSLLLRLPSRWQDQHPQDRAGHRYEGQRRLRRCPREQPRFRRPLHLGAWCAPGRHRGGPHAGLATEARHGRQRPPGNAAGTGQG